MIKSEIITDSITESGARITTYVLTYPRFIHSEFMTHRALSRNASSSRAIPTPKFMEAIKTEPAMPLAFTKNCKGMQAKDVLDNQDDAVKVWLEARDLMLQCVQKLSDLGVHKQHANRLLEPFQHITVVATATDWPNFFGLRKHPDAQPEFQALASSMWKNLKSSEPKSLALGEWHLPFVTEKEFDKLRVLKCFDLKSEYANRLQNLIKQSVARCARTSYNTHDGTDNTLEKDLDLYSKLVGGFPIHASPTEHQAKAIGDRNEQSGNFKGWLQYRKTLSNENIKEFLDYKEVE